MDNREAQRIWREIDRIERRNQIARTVFFIAAVLMAALFPFGAVLGWIRI